MNHIILTKEQENDDMLLTFIEAQHYLKVARATIYRMMWSGRLQGYKVGETWRFWKHDLDACTVKKSSRDCPPMQWPEKGRQTIKISEETYHNLKALVDLTGSTIIQTLDQLVRQELHRIQQ